jgi:hypothetical protein
MGLARQGFHKDLHAAAEAQDKARCRDHTPFNNTSCHTKTPSLPPSLLLGFMTTFTETSAKRQAAWRKNIWTGGPYH